MADPLIQISPPMTPRAKHLSVGVGPHVRAGGTLATLQARWLLALAPAMAAGIYTFGPGALRVLCLTVFFALAIDTVAERIAPSGDRTTNWSSVTFGVLLAFFLPLNAPWWLILVGCLLMIVVGKKLLGGWGGYPVHPVLMTLAMLRISWPERLDYTAALVGIDWAGPLIEPLRYVRSAGGGAEALFSWQDLLLGRQVAGIGNAMVLFLLLGGLMLLVLREIPWQLPCGFLGGLLVTAVVVRWFGEPGQFATPQFYLLAGSTVLAAFFLITDYPTSPVGSLAMLLYAALGGTLVMLIRAFSIYPDGVVFGILLVNLTFPLIDRIAGPVVGAGSEP